ncbi:hypothetical protein ABLE92_13995 [Gordonia sp. VNQ95]|uniref:hypothetical protein n=1 Tax=Gordonia sp. VNQ95 TaxID=3156619 RepID=UPI0032B53021
MARNAGGPIRPHRNDGDSTQSRRSTRTARTGEGEVVVAALSADHLDQDRLQRLRGLGIKVRQAEIGELVREDAARAQASVPFRSEIVDRDAFGSIVHLLVAYFYDNGRVDPLRALRRSNIDSYLSTRARPTRRTVRYLLYAAGRRFHPNEFPPALTLDAPRQNRTSPATKEDIAALYRVALTLGEKWGPALTVLLDLMVGAGARPEELKHLRRSDVRIERHHGQRWVIVTLQTPRTDPRDVPIIDAEIGYRLERYVADARHDHLLAFGSNPTVERNGINRVNDRLAERDQPERVNSKALRHAWMREAAGVFPVDQFCYLAGIRSLSHVDELDLVTDSTGAVDEITSYLADGVE